MRYRIEEFEFDSVSLVLMKAGEVIAIRHNEAKVLALLLKNTDKVLSKEDILSQVWQGKIVSEQAVFQNISHIRNLFGNKAIKTFPKRGYQWLLNVDVSSDTLLITDEAARKANVSSTSSSIQAANPTKSVREGYWPYVFLIALFAIIFGFNHWQNGTDEESSTPTIKLAYIPIIDPKSALTLPLNDSKVFDFTELTHIDSENFLTSAELEYPNLAKRYPFIITGTMRHYQQRVYLDFLLKGPYADWKGQLSASSNEVLIDQLKKHLSQPFIYQFLNSRQSPNFKKSSLSIAHQKLPQDRIILCQLINIYIETREFDKAMALAEKLATNARDKDDWLKLGNALLYQSTILTAKELYELSEEKLAQAMKAFESINELSRLADVWNAQSWLDHKYDDYQAVQKSLVKSAQLAFAAGDKARELHALTYLSIMAHKHKQEDDKYAYLRQAEDKMKTYKLPIYHFAKVPYHYAIFAKTPLDKEPHLRQVLEFTKLTPNHWVAQSSRKQLVKQYIDQGRLQEAQMLVDSVSTDNAEISYLKTLLAKENHQIKKFVSQAQRTFEQAQLAGANTLSLNVALLLCSTPNMDVNYDFYSLYIDENASEHWRQANKVKLLALNL
jgi:DNA-binding winged helix-turn-helix (wHTH) protein